MSELLAAAEERWRLTVDNAPVGIALVDLHGRCFDANDALCRIYDYPIETLIGLHTRDVILPEDYTTFQLLTRDLLDGRIPRFQVRKQHVRSDGGVVWLDLYVALARTPDGAPAHFLLYFEDVSEHIATAARLDRINRELTEQSTRLARSNADLEAFAAVASHDLQAPLATIRGYVELLQSEYGDRLDARGSLWLDRAAEAADRMSDLLTSLLQFSRTVGGGEPRLAPVSVEDVLSGVLADLDGTLAEVGLLLHHVGTDTEVVADPRRLHQVLQNLLQNAIKYRHPDRPLEVSVAVLPEQDRWRIEVTDNGVGVPEEQREAVFAMFRQTGLPGHAEDSGYGVGLAVSRRLVERHGGTIWVEASESGGSRFCFTLPRVLPQRAPGTASSRRTGG